MSKLLWGVHEKEEISGALGRARERWGYLRRKAGSEWILFRI